MPHVTSVPAARSIASTMTIVAPVAIPPPAPRFCRFWDRARALFPMSSRAEVAEAAYASGGELFSKGTYAKRFDREAQPERGLKMPVPQAASTSCRDYVEVDREGALT
jgi:hypothetical protein